MARGKGGPSGPQLPGMPKLPGRVSQARRRAAGDSAEARADALHKVCELAGVAYVRRVASNVRIVRNRRSGGTLGAVFTGKSTVDCWGMLLATDKDGARPVAVEIKSCASGRLDLSILPQHQRDELARVERGGGLALLLVVGREAIWAVPWYEVNGWLGVGKATAGPLELGQWLVTPGRPYLARWRRVGA